MTGVHKKCRCWRKKRAPQEFFILCNRLGILPTRWLLVVYTGKQKMDIFKKEIIRTIGNKLGFTPYRPFATQYRHLKTVIVSTSKFGVGQREGSFKTPLGLHRIAKKIGGGFPVGTAFKCRQPIGLTWKTAPDATIVHRIMWLEGLEEGFNRGGDVDSFKRYIYIHGFSDETTIGRPFSHGCIHLASDDLIPLFDIVPEGTLVFITDKSV